MGTYGNVGNRAMSMTKELALKVKQNLSKSGCFESAVKTKWCWRWKDRTWWRIGDCEQTRRQLASLAGVLCCSGIPKRMEGGSHNIIQRESYLAAPFTYHHVAVTFRLRGAMAPTQYPLGCSSHFHLEVWYQNSECSQIFGINLLS